MDKAFAWLEELMTFIYSLIPHITTINANERGVKFSGGKKFRELPPGLSLYWPLVTDAPTAVPVARQSLNIAANKLTTSDGMRIMISFSIVFHIANVYNAAVKTADLDGTIRDIAAKLFVGEVLGMTWPSLQDAVRSGKLHQTVLAEASNGLADYGIIVEDVVVTDLAETLVIAHVGDGFLIGDGGDDE